VKPLTSIDGLRERGRHTKTSTGLEADGCAEELQLGAGVYLLIRWPHGIDARRLRENEEVTFGRAEDATVTIPDSHVSRFHAKLRLKSGVLSLADLDSRNGTRINGRIFRGEERRAHGGDVIHIGPLEIAVARLGGRVPIGLAREEGELEGVVVADPEMRRVFEIAHRLAQTQTTVLIIGETGSGKELIAERIHRWSARKAGAFVKLSCAGVPEPLIEAELFGAASASEQIGFFEKAHGGTLFLDEIGELPLNVQAKLLAVLEDRRIFRAGSTMQVPADVRLLCATQRDLERDVADGRFREDLYYRINTFTLRIPPLRERPGEIALLAYHWAQTIAAKHGLPEAHIAPDAMTALVAHRWPGNVRELRNAIEHAIVLATLGQIRRTHLPSGIQRAGAIGEADFDDGTRSELNAQLALVERRSIEEALRAENGNQTRAAKRLGITRRALLYRMERLGLKRSS
jgi:two-component system, NtrC family, response regulator AtoC